MAIGWKKMAQQKQEAYKDRLGLTGSGVFGPEKTVYEHILSDQDASMGANFYCYQDKKEWESLQECANQDKVCYDYIGCMTDLKSRY